ncbi:MAG: SDR family oxidoreductase [Gammaproteobacteria bacterium]|jgi:NAD(P)-dependent dehydrogenase (short-subunit alcohol dehydrogenase family)|nr:SDR family oxidoreductase [Gammaproteobacteria bacterium]
MSMLQGKTAIVIGASAEGGIGWETARLFAEEGARVVVSARSSEPLHKLATEIDGLAISCDVTEAGSISRLVEATVDALGPPHVGVYSPGQASSKMIEELTRADTSEEMVLHYEGALTFLQSMAKAMTGSGAITFMSSILSGHYYPGMTAYASAKAALEQLVRYAAVEYAAKGLRVNSIRPTSTRTPMVEEALAIPGLEETAIKEIPMGRIAEPREIAEAAAWLSSDRASFVTGVNLPVDGGNHLMRMPHLADMPTADDLDAAYKND